MHKTVILQASASSFGNTYKVIQQLNKTHHFDCIDLATKNINHFDYDFKNEHDDFLPLITDVILKYDTIIFATPVYWYSMSGILKVFFDRISDLLIKHKTVGKQLRGKKMGVISNSLKNDLKEGFTMPFVASAQYLGMQYTQHTHVWFTKNGKEIHPQALENLKNLPLF